MRVFIKSREEAEKYSASKIDYKVAIISISSYDDRQAELADNENIVDVLRLSFDDCDFDSPKSMTTEDAEKIANFVYKYQNEVDELVVHCLMGISRSAGIAAAITQHLFGTCSHIYYSRKYEPNGWCYDLTYKALTSFNK